MARTQTSGWWRPSALRPWDQNISLRDDEGRRRPGDREVLGPRLGFIEESVQTSHLDLVASDGQVEEEKNTSSSTRSETAELARNDGTKQGFAKKEHAVKSSHHQGADRLGWDVTWIIKLLMNALGCKSSLKSKLTSILGSCSWESDGREPLP